MEKFFDHAVRLVREAKTRQGSFRALCLPLGLNPTTVQKWFTEENEGKPRAPSLDQIGKILDSLGVQIVAPGEQLASYVFLPCGAPTVANGSLMLAGAGHEPIAFDRNWLENKGINPDQAVMVIANAGNMAPTFSQGELVLVDKSDTRPQPNGIFLLIRQDEPSFHRLILTTQGWTLHCDSPQWAMHCETVPSLDDITIVGRVRWAGRMFD